MMNFEVAPILDATFGAQVTGLRLTEINEATFADLYQTWLEYALLIFPCQHLSTDEQIFFAKRFGDLEFDLIPISNVCKDGTVRPEDDNFIKLLKGNDDWHFDSTFVPVQAKGAVFTAHVVPSSGGATGWADMRAAYDALDTTMRDRIATLSAYHSLRHSQAKIGHDAQKGAGYDGYGLDVDPPLRPLVKTHPETRRKSLLLGRHAYGIIGLTDIESEVLLQELQNFACQPPRTYHHNWKPGDAVLWDNRCLMHQSTPWPMNEPRIMYHTRIAGDEESEFASHA
jgi:alpha-ketoglutarate-dependent taurine dioxygenase